MQACACNPMVDTLAPSLQLTKQDIQLSKFLSGRSLSCTRLQTCLWCYVFETVGLEGRLKAHFCKTGPSEAAQQMHGLEERLVHEDSRSTGRASASLSALL